MEDLISRGLRPTSINVEYNNIFVLEELEKRLLELEERKNRYTKIVFYKDVFDEFQRYTNPDLYLKKRLENIKNIKL